MTATTTTRTREGFTLIELLVAIVLLTFGLLAMVSTSASLVRALHESTDDNVAALAAQSRVEKLAGTACASIPRNQVQVATTRGVTERYRIVDGGNATLSIIDSVSWQTRGGTRRVTVVTLLPCRPGA